MFNIDYHGNLYRLSFVYNNLREKVKYVEKNGTNVKQHELLWRQTTANFSLFVSPEQVSTRHANWVRVTIREATALCSTEDRFTRMEGRAIAFGRLLAELIRLELQKDLLLEIVQKFFSLIKISKTMVRHIDGNAVTFDGHVGLGLLIAESMQKQLKPTTVSNEVLQLSLEVDKELHRCAMQRYEEALKANAVEEPATPKEAE